MKKSVGYVTAEERDEIQNIFDRRTGLTELAKILTSDNNELYERLIKDIAETSTKFESWWDEMVKKYNWESHPQGHWEIDFKDCEVFLVTPD